MASGRVRLCPAAGAGPVLGGPVEGVLKDASAHGFRAIHHCPALASGQLVAFEHARGSGRARVIWTRIAGDQIESGFCYVPAGAP